jgi:probable rRNA maturation factor
MRLRLSVQRETRERGLPANATFLRWAQAALAGSGAGVAEVNIRLVDMDESRSLNARYRGKRRPTNVLSFTYDSPAGHPGVVGDLVICAPVVAREAEAQGKARRAHWAHLVVHGILHLLGHDHVRETDAQAMETAEIRILKRLGFANPYF